MLSTLRISRRLGARLAAPAAAALMVAAAPAVSAAASPAGLPILPHQYFTGLVIGKTALSKIEVGCAGPMTTGHPLPGQSVEVNLYVTSPASTAGYTGSLGRRISADLTYSVRTVTVIAHIATFTAYSVQMPIPTTITVPCNGSGVMNFSPKPTSKTAQTASVAVTFFSLGV